MSVNGILNTPETLLHAQQSHRPTPQKTSKFHITELCVTVIHQWLVDSPHKGTVRQNSFLCHVVTMHNTVMTNILFRTYKRHTKCHSHRPAVAVLRNCHAKVLWKLVQYCKQFPLLHLPDLWNLQGTDLLGGFQSFQGALNSTESDSI